jgi:hypothetical protein
MRGIIPPDPETRVSQIHYAVVYVPRRSRNRFAANCVELAVDRKSALEAADADKNLYAAKVAGPSKSSEGQYIYYLLEWLK